MSKVERIRPSLAATSADARKMEDSGFIERNELRTETYRFLSVCFYQPEKNTLENMPIFDCSETHFKALNIEGLQCLSPMREEFSASPLEELLVEYARLFVGPFELVAPPYGSVYLDPNRVVMGDSTMKVLRAYREAGLELSDSLREPPDHIAVELEFMHFLASCSAWAGVEGDQERAMHYMKIQEEFLSQFLSPWISPFCQRIRQGSENAFYRTLADCLSAFIHKDRHDVSSLLKEAAAVEKRTSHTCSR